MPTVKAVCVCCVWLDQLRLWLPSLVVWQVVEDGYEFFARRHLVTLFSAPNYCGEFDNAGAMMSVDDTLMCSFQASRASCALDGTRRHGHGLAAGWYGIAWLSM